MEKYSVLLLEAGGSDLNLWNLDAIGYGKTFYRRSLNWMYETEPNSGLNGRVSYWPRGKVMGGSSSINAMVYVPGQRQDFEDWKNLGNPGWGWDDVLPYFRKSETNDRGSDAHRGGGGPVHVATMDRDLHPLCQNFINAGKELQFRHNPDFNGPSQEGVGTYQNTVKDGMRMSSARAYIRPARTRAGLRVETHAQATRIVFEGKRAKGIAYRKNGLSKTAFARREVILSAGAINSPQLLQLSGVGPAALLRSKGNRRRAGFRGSRQAPSGSSGHRLPVSLEGPHAERSAAPMVWETLARTTLPADPTPGRCLWESTRPVVSSSRAPGCATRTCSCSSRRSATPRRRPANGL